MLQARRGLQGKHFPAISRHSIRLSQRPRGIDDAFVAKLNASGVLQFSTFLGISSWDGSSRYSGRAVAVDGAGNGYVTGYATGALPVTKGVVQATNQGATDAFVTKYGPAGAVLYSTMLGGASDDYGFGIAVDSAGSAYVTGSSYSSSFAGAPPSGAQTTNAGGGDVFVTELTPNATALAYFTFLGGTGLDQGRAIAVDASGNAYIAGPTSSTGLATAGAAQTTLAGASNGFVAKLNASGSAFSYVTYLGGTRVDRLSGLAVDGSGNVYIAGSSDSVNFPTSMALQPVFPGNGISVFQSTNSGSSFTPFDSNVPGAVFQVSINPAGTSAVALTESGIYRSTDGGTSWTLRFTPAPPFSFSSASYLTRSLAAPGTLYAIISCLQAYTSTDDGASWSGAGSYFACGTQSFAIVADPLSADTVYGFSPSFLNRYPFYKSTNGGASWAPVNTGLPTSVTALAAAPDGSLYAGTPGYGIYKSTNQAVSWAAVNSGLPAGATATALTVSGTTLYIIVGGVIYKSSDAAASWTALSGLSNVFRVAASPQNASVVYAVTYNFTSSSGAVEESSDGGKTWNVSGTGLPWSVLSVYLDLTVDPGNSAHVLVLPWTVNESGVVAKLNAAGSAPIWSTYLGGTALTQASAIATDGAGDAFVTGYTNGGGGFPVTPTALSPSPPLLVSAAFVAKLSDTTAACATLTVTPASTLAPQAGGMLTFAVVAPSGCSWAASTNESWAAMASGASGTGSGIVTLQIAANQTATTLSAVLTIGSQKGTITQPSSACTYSVDSTSYPITQAGGPVKVILTTAPGCPWTVTNIYPNAISVTSAPSGTGSATISLMVSPNPSTSLQTFGLPVGTTSITISQTVGTFQTITFGPLSNQTLGSSPLPLGATASSGLAVTFASNTTAVCVVSAVNVTLVAAGTCSITARQPGNSVYAAAAPVTQTFTVSATTGYTALQLLTVAPCRIMDTRTPAAGGTFPANSTFGSPYVAAGTVRSIPIPSSTCGVPASAMAYSLNFTVVPRTGKVGSLTVWPTGPAQPLVSTLTSPDGSVLAAAAIVPAGTAGSINASSTDDTDLVVDINGYFVPPATGTLQFYPLPPCRVLDTRLISNGGSFPPNSTFGSPSLDGVSGRSYPIPSSSCGVPAKATAYSFNVTAVPQGALGFVTAWPTGQTQPFVSTMNSYDGTVLANAAIVPAGTAGAVSFFASNPTDLAVDINGYFAPPGAGGLNFYTVPPCRLVDTTQANGSLGGPAIAALAARNFPLSQGPCGLPASPALQAYSLSITASPQGSLGYLSTWPTGGTQPFVSTLNGYKGLPVANAAIVPAGSPGSISVFVTTTSNVTIDTAGYFGP